MSTSEQVELMARARAEWIHKNPLRQWRMGGQLPVAQASVAIVLRKSTQAIRDYESGSYTPAADVFETMAVMMATKQKALQRRWQKWMRERPMGASKRD